MDQLSIQTEQVNITYENLNLSLMYYYCISRQTGDQNAGQTDSQTFLSPPTGNNMRRHSTPIVSSAQTSPPAGTILSISMEDLEKRVKSLFPALLKETLERGLESGPSAPKRPHMDVSILSGLAHLVASLSMRLFF